MVLIRALPWRRMLLSLPILGLLAVIGDAFVEDDNFRIVNQDVFRSGQLRVDEWREAYEEHPFRSIINLRGPNHGTSWYDVEVKFAAEHGVQHIDYPLSARVAPSVKQMEQLVSLMSSAPKPVLIHCDGGADRSGLASGLYVYALDGASAVKATNQLSLWYGHFPWLASKTGAMDRALDSFMALHPPASGKPVGFHQLFNRTQTSLQG